MAMTLPVGGEGRPWSRRIGITWAKHGFAWMAHQNKLPCIDHATCKSAAIFLTPRRSKAPRKDNYDANRQRLRSATPTFYLPAAWKDDADGRGQAHRYLGGFYHAPCGCFVFETIIMPLRTQNGLCKGQPRLSDCSGASWVQPHGHMAFHSFA